MAKRFPQCPSQHKDCYPSQKIALRVLLSCTRKRGTPLRTYFHQDCKSWHISSRVRVDNDSRRVSA